MFKKKKVCVGGREKCNLKFANIFIQKLKFTSNNFFSVVFVLIKGITLVYLK